MLTVGKFPLIAIKEFLHKYQPGVSRQAVKKSPNLVNVVKECPVQKFASDIATIQFCIATQTNISRLHCSLFYINFRKWCIVISYFKRGQSFNQVTFYGLSSRKLCHLDTHYCQLSHGVSKLWLQNWLNFIKKNEWALRDGLQGNCCILWIDIAWGLQKMSIILEAT